MIVDGQVLRTTSRSEPAPNPAGPSPSVQTAPRAGRATMRDIAQELGITITTVSRALNDKPDVSEETRQRVQAAASRLSYVRSALGSGLATGYVDAVVLPERAVFRCQHRAPQIGRDAPIRHPAVYVAQRRLGARRLALTQLHERGRRRVIGRQHPHVGERQIEVGDCREDHRDNRRQPVEDRS